MKQCVWIAGVNDAGKSTLCQVLKSIKQDKKRSAYWISKGGHDIPDDKRFTIYQSGKLCSLVDDCPKWYDEFRV